MAKKLYGSSKKYHYIYKTTNLISGKYYIGMHSTNDLNDGYMGSGTLLKRSLNKYGKENHSIEILEYVSSREELAAREKEIVSLQEIAKKECMNLKVGGSGGFTSENARKGRAATDKILIEKYGENFRQIIGKNIYINETPEQKYNRIEKIKRRLKEANFNHATFKGKNHSEKTKQKMSEIKKGKGIGKDNSQYGTCWINNGKEVKKIKKEELFLYTNWKLGRK